MKNKAFFRILGGILIFTMIFSGLFYREIKNIKANPAAALALTPEGLEALLTLLALTGVEISTMQADLSGGISAEEFEKNSAFYLSSGYNYYNSDTNKYYSVGDSLLNRDLSLNSEQIGYLNSVGASKNEQGLLSYFGDGLEYIWDWYVDLFASADYSTSAEIALSNGKQFITGSDGKFYVINAVDWNWVGPCKDYFSVLNTAGKNSVCFTDVEPLDDAAGSGNHLSYGTYTNEQVFFNNPSRYNFLGNYKFRKDIYAIVNGTKYYYVNIALPSDMVSYSGFDSVVSYTDWTSSKPGSEWSAQQISDFITYVVTGSTVNKLKIGDTDCAITEGSLADYFAKDKDCPYVNNAFDYVTDVILGGQTTVADAESGEAIPVTGVAVPGVSVVQNGDTLVLTPASAAVSSAIPLTGTSAAATDIPVDSSAAADSDIVSGVVSGIISGLLRLFVPDAGVVNGFCNEVSAHFNNTFGFQQLDLGQLFGDEKPPDDIFGTIAYGKYKYQGKVVDFNFFLYAISIFKPYIRAFLALLIILYNINQFLGLIGLQTLSLGSGINFLMIGKDEKGDVSK